MSPLRSRTPTCVTEASPDSEELAQIIAHHCPFLDFSRLLMSVTVFSSKIIQSSLQLAMLTRLEGLPCRPARADVLVDLLSMKTSASDASDAQEGGMGGQWLSHRRLRNTRGTSRREPESSSFSLQPGPWSGQCEMHFARALAISQGPCLVSPSLRASRLDVPSGGVI